MEIKIKNFRDLKIWQRGMTLVENVYKMTEKFPKEETYGLVSQMRRSAISIPSNIAEGFRRQHIKEYRQFLSIALGSCGELETQVEIAQRIGLISVENSLNLLEEIETLCKMIHSLMNKLS